MKPTTSNMESSSRPDLSIKTTASSSKYTSLREILPESPQRRGRPPPPPPPTPPPDSPVKSPAMRSEIPIRNPLVKQAALAYLQPMAGRPPGTAVEQGIFGKFKEVCCGWQCGCLEWLVSMDFFGNNTDEEDDSDLSMRPRTTGGRGS